MKVIRCILPITLLVAGVLLGTRIASGRAATGEPAGTALPSDTASVMLIRAGETLDLQAAGVDKHIRQTVTLPNIVRLMEPQAIENLLAAVGAATRLPLMLEDEQVFLPLLRR